MASEAGESRAIGTETSGEVIRPRRPEVSSQSGESEKCVRGLMHEDNLGAYFFQGTDEAFVVVCDQAYFRGLWALLNSIYVYHGARRAVFVYGSELTAEQLRRLSEHPLWILYRDYSKLPKEARGPWEAKQQVFAALIEEVRCAYLLDADLVLTSKVDGVFALASRGRIVASREREEIEFGDAFSRFDPDLVGQNRIYLNSGNICLDCRRYWQVAALWSFSSGYGAYSPGGGAPLALPGHGDQGLLSGILAMTQADKATLALSEEEWCQSQSVSPLKIEVADPAGRIRVRNQTTGRWQRLVHSSGEKWWTEEGRARNSGRGDKLRCFEHFETLIPVVPQTTNSRGNPPRVIVGVCSSAGNETQREACRQSWASHVVPGIEVVFFAGKEAPEEERLWRLDCDDEVESQSLKVQAFFKKALEQEACEYVLKCSDDTYLVLERILELVSETDADLVGDLTLDGPGRHLVGGSGYLVSRTLLEGYCDIELPNVSYEDALISWWSREQGFRLSAISRFQGNSDVWPNSENQIISVGGLAPEEMRRLHEEFCPLFGDEWYRATHSQWEATLKLRANGRFGRDEKTDEGEWKKEKISNGPLVLRWNDRPKSILTQVPTGYSDGELLLERIDQQEEIKVNRVSTPGSGLRRVILKCELSPGDVVTLTAAVRDLQLSHPDHYLIDVRTLFPQLWENNEFLTRLEESDPAIELIECAYPLINEANRLPYHMIHGFRKFLVEKLEVNIRPHDFRGHILLSEEEKSWISQVEEIEGEGTRFWIIVSGGKRDFTAKWWDPERAQAVVDHFAGRIRFVQCGQANDVHPPLENVLNLVGKTDMRQLVRLMHHADGVICPVTLFMHLAAAVESKPGRPANRPCVVIAGGREPAHWEAYPHHQFLHTMGALPCCEHGGCWKSRVEALGDGAEQDQSLCLRPVTLSGGRQLPKCLDMITSGDVIRAVEFYLEFDSAERHGTGCTAGDTMTGGGEILPRADLFVEDKHE